MPAAIPKQQQMQISLEPLNADMPYVRGYRPEPTDTEAEMEALEATIIMGSPSNHAKSRPHIENLRRSQTSPALGEYPMSEGSRLEVSVSNRSGSKNASNRSPKKAFTFMRSGSRLRDEMEEHGRGGPIGSPQQAA